MKSMFELLRTRRFSPMFITMFLTSINDNLVKKGLTLYMAYQASIHSYHSMLWTSLISGLFMMPFFFLSTLGGEWADRYPKSKYIQYVKLSEIPIVALVCYLILSPQVQPIYYALGVFLMGCHSALFGTAKYAYLPEYLDEDELLGANGLMESFTLMGIVTGISLSYLIQTPVQGPHLLSVLMVTISVLGYLASLFIPEKAAADPELTLTWNILKGTQSMIDYVHENPHLWASILGISWFWFMGSFFLEQLPNYVNYSLKACAEVAVLLNLVSTLGIGLGSLMCHRILHGKTDLRATPITLLLVSFFGLHFAYGSSTMGSPEVPVSLGGFALSFQGIRLIFDLFFMCFACGLYLVPLYAKLQSLSTPTHRSRVIAAFNIISALWMVSANLVHIIFVNWWGLSIERALSFLMLVNLVIACYLIKLIPFSMIKPVVRWMLQKAFRIEIEGLEHLQNLPERTIIICNHVSYLDVPILAAFLPGNYSFAIDTHVAKKRMVRLIRHLAPYYEIDPGNAMKMKGLIRAIQQGDHCIIFPEGRITNTGHIMKIYDGVVLLAERTQAHILPLHIDGAIFSITSRPTGHPKIFFPKIRIKILPPSLPPTYAHLELKEQRTLQRLWIFDQLTEAKAFCRPVDNLYEMIRLSMKEMGSKRVVLEDISQEPLSYGAIFLKTEVLSQVLASALPSGKTVGVLLPNVQGKVISILALYRLGKVPALLNYSAGTKNMLSAALTAECACILTSRSFIEKANLEESISAFTAHHIPLIYTEELKHKLSVTHKIKGAVTHHINQWKKRVCATNPEDAAVVLFTSGSEGTPKGVVLSHANIVHNIHQSMALAGLVPDDIIFNVLPMFHSFGFTLGTLAPLLIGCRVFLYPNPRHYHHVVELIYNHQATIMIGTNTFLLAYQKVADVHDFQSLRRVYVGGEKLSQETCSLWFNKFGIRLLEGYGTTECSPVVTINTATHNKPGAVGRLMPGMSYRLEPFEGRPEGGVLCLQGPNIMKGYLYAHQPGVLHPSEPWYSTGDVVTIDDYGFITIVDRAKRFAKIGGEMLSLTAIEHEIHTLWPDYLHAVISVAEEHKGERLILYTTHPDADRKRLIEHFNHQGLSNLSIPGTIQIIEQMPVLGTGKVDYQSLIRAQID